MHKKILSGVWAALVLSAGCIFLSCASEQPDVISSGVFIGDQDVGGMTVEEAEAYVKGEVKALEDSVITIQMGEDQVSATWKDLGLKWKNTDLIDEVSQIGTTGNIVRRYKEQKDLQNQSSRYEIEYTMDEAAEEALVESCREFNSEPVEGTAYMGEDGALHVEGGTDGLTLDYDATLAALKQQIETYTAGDVVLDATVERVSPVVTAEMLSRMTDVLGDHGLFRILRRTRSERAERDVQDQRYASVAGRVVFRDKRGGSVQRGERI